MRHIHNETTCRVIYLVYDDIPRVYCVPEQVDVSRDNDIRGE